MPAYFHIVGCVVASAPAGGLIQQFLGRVRQQDAQVIAHNEREAVFAKYDAADAQLIALACRAVAAQDPSVLRFGFASGVKEVDAAGAARLGERGIVQACDLAGGADSGKVLVSSQLGSLIMVAQAEFSAQMVPSHIRLANGRTISAYVVDWRAQPKMPAPKRA